MKDIKQIVADNLIELRKKHNLTQNELAEKLSYSDNMISRWERAEVSPSIETLEKIAELYKIPMQSLFQENLEQSNQNNEKIENIKKLSIILLLLTAVWFFIIIFFVYQNAIFQKVDWLIFVLGVPLSCIVLLFFNRSSNKTLYRFIVLSVLIWSLITFLYLYFIKYNLFLIYIVGVPAQLALSIWAFLKPRQTKKQG